jgi:hypothetical protein
MNNYVQLLHTVAPGFKTLRVAMRQCMLDFDTLHKLIPLHMVLDIIPMVQRAEDYQADFARMRRFALRERGTGRGCVIAGYRCVVCRVGGYVYVREGGA